jgi:16S rRNA (guanine(527)-N(7))-methyltransferase RsmG
VFHVEQVYEPPARNLALFHVEHYRPIAMPLSAARTVTEGPIPIELERDTSVLLERLPELCPEATPDQLAGWGSQLSRYVSLLYVWSGRTNLVSAQGRLRLATSHLLPSLAMRKVLIGIPHQVIADLGSGSGLPGVPLKISLPGADFHLIEARRRRANFLREVVRRLALDRVEVVNGRIEEWGCPEGKRPHVIVSRATMASDQLARCCAGVLRSSGRVLFTLPADATLDAHGPGSPRVVDTGVEDSQGRSIRIGVLRLDSPA